MEQTTKKILAIDDNEDNLLTLKALIFDLFNNYQVFTATSGIEGIELAKIHNPDLILLDILMPQMDGFATCKLLKEDEKLRDIPVIFVTALKESRENKVKAIEVGAEGFLTKPVDENELSAHIKAFIKIKEANDLKKNEKERLEGLVLERTKLLREELRQNREISERLIQINKRLEAFLQISQKITTMFNHHELIQEIVENAISAIDVGCCSLYMLRDNNIIELITSFPALPEKVPTHFKFSNIEDHPHIQTAITKNRITLIEDTKLEILSPAEQFVVENRDLRSILYVPISLNDRLIGLLILASVTNKKIFCEDDVKLLKGFTTQLAQVFANSEHLENIKNYTNQLEVEIAEKNLAEKNFKHSIDDSPLGIRIVNQDGLTVYANQAFLDIYEFSSVDEFMQTKAQSRYTEQSYIEHLERKRIRRAGGDVSSYEISILRKNGELRHIKVWRKEVIWNKEKHFQVINQDITEQKKLYDDLVTAKERAEESDRLKSAFLANMNHEIRTPMNGILGFMELLTDPDLTEKEKLEYYDIMKRSGERLLNTINDIIEISKIEAHLVNIQRSRFCMACLMKEITDFFSPEAAKKGLKLNLHLEEPTLKVNTDLAKIESILTNLIKNAIKFTHTGEINVTLSRNQNDSRNGHTADTLPEKSAETSFDQFSETTYRQFARPTICLTISDTGEGIPKDKLDKIFERFTQAERTLNRVYEGSGLGLSITKEYVRLLNGTIRVDSEVNKGSTFIVEFPQSELQ